MSKLAAFLAETLRWVRERGVDGVPILLLLLVLAGALSSMGGFVALDLAARPSLERRIGVEAIPSGLEGIEWTPAAAFPDAAREAGMERSIRLTLSLLSLVALVAFFGLLGLWSEETAARRFETAVRRAVGASRRRALLERLSEAAMLVALAGAVAVVLGEVVRFIVASGWSGVAHLRGPEGGASPVATAILWPLLAIALSLVARLLSFFTELTPGSALAAKTPLTMSENPGGAHPLLSLGQIALVTSTLLGGVVMFESRAEVAGGEDRSDRPEVTLHVAGIASALPSPSTGADGAALKRMLREVGADPRVGTVGFATPGIIGGLGVSDRVMTECGACVTGGMWTPFKSGRAVHNLVTSDTFAALGMDIFEGRSFLPSDGPEGEPVAVVSRSIAERYFERGRPLGKTIRVGTRFDRWYTIVGVVEEAGRTAIGAESQPPGEVYLSALQHTVTNGVLLVEGPAGVEEGLDETVSRAGFALGDVASFGARLDRFGQEREWFVRVWIAAGGAGLLVALFGVFATLRRKTREEIREIGIRRAAGARRRAILLHYLAFGLKLGGSGTVLGLWLGLFLVAELPVASIKPSAVLPGFVWAGVVPVVLSAIVGSVVPALRAARASPSEAIEGTLTLVPPGRSRRGGS